VPTPIFTCETGCQEKNPVWTSLNFVFKKNVCLGVSGSGGLGLKTPNLKKDTITHIFTCETGCREKHRRRKVSHVKLGARDETETVQGSEAGGLGHKIVCGVFAGTLGPGIETKNKKAQTRGFRLRFRADGRTLLSQRCSPEVQRDTGPQTPPSHTCCNISNQIRRPLSFRTLSYKHI
jgi:ribosomal protein L34